MNILACPDCGQKNRLAAAPRQRCGKCRREFLPHEVLKAAFPDHPDVPESPSRPPISEGILEEMMSELEEADEN